MVDTALVPAIITGTQDRKELFVWHNEFIDADDELIVAGVVELEKLKSMIDIDLFHY